MDASRVSLAPLYDGGGNVPHVYAAGDVATVFTECVIGAWGALGLAVFHGADALYVDVLGLDFRIALGPADGCALFIGDPGAFGGGIFMVGLCLAGVGMARGLVPFFPKLQCFNFGADDYADHQGETREFVESGEAFPLVFYRRDGGLALRERSGEFSGLGSFCADGSNCLLGADWNEPLVFYCFTIDPAHRPRK